MCNLTDLVPAAIFRRDTTIANSQPPLIDRISYCRHVNPSRSRSNVLMPSLSFQSTHQYRAAAEEASLGQRAQAQGNARNFNPCQRPTRGFVWGVATVPLT